MTYGEIFQEIKSALDKFIKQNPNDKPTVVLSQDTFEKIKRNSPKNTYDTGNSVTIFGKDFVVEDIEDEFIIRKK